MVEMRLMQQSRFLRKSPMISRDDLDSLPPEVIESLGEVS